MVDFVGRLGRRDFDHQSVDVLVGQRLLADLARLAVFHQGDGLVGEQVQLVRPLPQHHIDERIEACGHRRHSCGRAYSTWARFTKWTPSSVLTAKNGSSEALR